MGKELFFLDFHNWSGILLALIPAVINICLAVYVRFRMPRNATTRFFSLLVLAIAFWQFTDAFTRMSAGIQTAALWDAAFSTAWVLVLPLALHFSLYFIGKDKFASSSIIQALIYLPAFAFDAFYKLSLESHKFAYRESWGWVNARTGTVYDTLLMFWMSGLGVLTAGILYYYAFNTGKNTAAFKRTLLIAFGFTIPLVQGIITEMALPLVYGLPALPLTSTTMCLFSAAALMGLKKYKLFQVPDFVNKQLLLETMDDIVITFSADKTLTYINTFGANFLGFDRQNLSQYKLQNIFKEVSTYIAFEKNAFAGTNKGTFETDFTNINGESKTVQVTAKTIQQRGSADNYLIVGRDISKQKEAQQQIELNEQRFRIFIEKSSDGLLTLNEKGIIVYTSPSCEDILGYSASELIGENVFTYIHADDLETSNNKLFDILSVEGGSNSGKVRWKHKNGEWVWIEGSWTNLLHEPGVNAIIGNFRDVSNRINIEKENSETLALFNSIISHDNDGILIEDRDSNVIWANEALIKTYRLPYSIKEIIGQNCNSLFENIRNLIVDPELFLENVNTIITGQSISFSQIEFIDGSIYELNYVPVHTAKNEFVGHLWKYTNVTDRVNTLKKIQRQTAYMQQLYDASPYGIVMLDNNDCLVNANAAFEEMFQYSTNEMKGRPINDLIVPPDMHAEASHVSESCLQKRIIQIESKRKRKDGEIIDVLIVGYPIVIDNTLSGIYGLYANITERKRAEMDLITKNLELLKINKELDMFVYSASHDIRAPLMSVLGLINLSEAEMEENPSVRQYLTMMRTSILKLDDFVTEIIHYSKNARVNLNNELLDIEVLIEEVFSNLKYHEGSNNIKLIFKNKVTEPVYADKSRLYNVLNNLVSNSIKYHNYLQETPYILIRAEIVDGILQFQVEDNGSGIAEQSQDKIFDMFFRASEKSVGSGLGLYIAKEMVEKMNGNIYFNSTEGKGTTFYLNIPNNIEANLEPQQMSNSSHI